MSNEEPRLVPGLFHWFSRKRSIVVVSAMVGTLLLLSEGCASPSPRFGTRSRAEEREKKTDGTRFSSRETEEEKREDDKKVDPELKERILAGKRDFRKERNPSITPLDQSKMMREISRYMGVPYHHGGTSSEGMDCSAYTMLVYANAIGKRLPRTTEEQFKVGKPVAFDDLKFGDLVFFNTTGTPASHVGIYLGDDLFAHASVTLGVTISSLQSSYFKNRYEGARRIVE
jgi:cell wall-associated NlpC family hydrolase